MHIIPMTSYMIVDYILFHDCLFFDNNHRRGAAYSILEDPCSYHIHEIINWPNVNFRGKMS